MAYEVVIVFSNRDNALKFHKRLNVHAYVCGRPGSEMVPFREQCTQCTPLIVGVTTLYMYKHSLPMSNIHEHNQII